MTSLILMTSFALGITTGHFVKVENGYCHATFTVGTPTAVQWRILVVDTRKAEVICEYLSPLEQGASQITSAGQVMHVVMPVKKAK